MKRLQMLVIPLRCEKTILILISPRVLMTKHHYFLGTLKEKMIKKCSFISTFSVLVCSTSAGSLPEQWLVIKRIPWYF